jgi:hypothetical protein
LFIDNGKYDYISIWKKLDTKWHVKLLF